MPGCALSAGMAQRGLSLLSQKFLQVSNTDAEVLAVCKLYPASYGRAEDVMTASLSRRAQQVLAVDISGPDTKLVTGNLVSSYMEEGSSLESLKHITPAS